MSRRQTGPDPDLLDPRQRHAAALMLIAIDFPVAVTPWAKQIEQACSVCPGLTIDHLMNGGRVAMLKRVQFIIAEMIAEAEAPAT